MSVGQALQEGENTLDLSDIDAELVALFQHPSSAFLNEIIEARGKLVHAAAQVFKAKVDGGQLVGHGRCIVRRSAHAGAERGFERRHN